MTGKLPPRPFIVVLCLLMLAGCAMPPWASSAPAGPAPTSTRTPQSGQQSGLIGGEVDNAPPPAGWRRILNGERFTGPEGEQGLVTTLPKPGRLAGCALPAGLYDSGLPRFVLSDDGGMTWEAHTIPGAGQVRSCSLLADTQQPDTFAVFLPAREQVYFTTDAGSSWTALRPPPTIGSGVGVEGIRALVGGRLLILIYVGSSDEWHIAEVALRAGTWHNIEGALPNLHPSAYPGYLNLPLAVAVDPADPSHIYAGMTDETGAIALDVTHDDGASWRRVYQLATAKRIALWTAAGGRVYLEDQDDREATSYQFFYSPDSGATWQGIGLQLRQYEDIFISPGGRIVSDTWPEVDTAHLFALDAQTGEFTSLGTHQLGSGADIGIVVDGNSPMFIYATRLDTYALTLPR